MGAVIKRIEGIPVVYQQVIRWVEEYTRLVSQQVFGLQSGAYCISREWLEPTPADPWHTLELSVVGPMPRLTEQTPWAIEIKIREQQRGVSTEVITRCNVGDSVLDYFKELVGAMYEQWPAARVRTDYEFDEEDDPRPSSQTLDDAPDHYNLYPVKLDVVKGILADLESKWDERWSTARELPGYVLRGGSSLDLEISPRLFGPHKLKEGVWWGIATRDDDNVRMGRLEAHQLPSGETFVAYRVKDFPNSDIFYGIIGEIERELEALQAPVHEPDKTMQQETERKIAKDETKEIKDEKDVKLWELIPEYRWDRVAVEMWCNGRQGQEIANRLGLERSTIYNRLSKLRKLYPDVGIPTDNERKAAIH